MIVLESNKWVVIATDSKEVISEHPSTDSYTKGKAKDAALVSNEPWKAQNNG